MNSLKIKILGLVALIVLVTVTGASYLNYHLQKRLIIAISQTNLGVVTDTVRNSIVESMGKGHPEGVAELLRKVGGAHGISRLRILDGDGRILRSSNPAEVGDSASPEAVAALDRSLKGKESTFFSQGDLSSGGVFPIANESSCRKCHPQGGTIAFIELEIGTGHVNDLIALGRTVNFVSALLIIALIIVSLSVFLISYVDKPIQQLIASMERLEQGDFAAETTIDSSYEMHLLSEKLNKTATRLRDLVDERAAKERDLALAQESLAHHQEIFRMNQKLEEQLKEIEYLNISLEERIEDIEEANYKIADLAGELEDKNTTLQKTVARLSTLYKVGLAINSTMETGKLFNLIITTTVSALDAQIGYIILHDPESRELEVTTLVGFETLDKPGTRIPMTPSSVSTWVIDSGRPLLVADISEAPQFERYSLLGYERKTVICAPLVIKDRVIGTITAVNKTNNTTYTQEDLDLLTTIAAQASIAINNARLYEEQQKVYLNTIHALVSAIEASDSYTRGHSERVTRYSLGVGQKMNLEPERLKILERAAILHDIGKIGIDMTLLNKEGKLSREEVNDLQQHPAIGMKILEPIEFLQDVRLCVGQHHERYDGLGYPFGIAGDELLLESRILAVADAYDAMTSDRPYRKALPVEVAIQEISAYAGSQFDPEVVRHFIAMVRDEQEPGACAASVA